MHASIISNIDASVMMSIPRAVHDHSAVHLDDVVVEGRDAFRRISIDDNARTAADDFAEVVRGVHPSIR